MTPRESDRRFWIERPFAIRRALPPLFAVDETAGDGV
jgi:hypothetical protein